MSQTVHYKGTLKLIPKLNNETLENLCMREFNITEISGYDNIEEFIFENYYEEYLIYNDNLYQVNSQKLDYDYNIFNINKISEDIYDFEVMYYDGGCSFSESIEQAFKNIK